MRFTLVPAAVVAVALASSLCALPRPTPPARPTRPAGAVPGSPGEVPGPPGVAPGQAQAAALLFGGRIDLNRATVDDLAALPAVGPMRAAAIIEERAARGGRFDAVDDLLDVPGIGARTLDKIRPLVVIP